MAESDAVHQARVGQTIGDKYQVLRLLGVGGMGAVYEAENTWIKRRVALKVLFQNLAADPEVARRFMQEAQSATQINHPNIVYVLDMGRDARDGAFYIVQEFLEGADLRARLEKDKRLAIPDALTLIAPIMSALGAAHDRGIIHRDIKPENIFLSVGPAGEIVPKLIDFGVSKVLGEGVALTKTRTGMSLGTPYYMSPEQGRGDEIDGRSDVWAIGIVLYEMLCGRPPYEAANYNVLVLKVMTERPPRIEQFYPDIPPPLAEIIHSAIEPDLARRYPNMRAFLDALTQFGQTHANLRMSAMLPRNSVTNPPIVGITLGPVPPTAGMPGGFVQQGPPPTNVAMVGAPMMTAPGGSGTPMGLAQQQQLGTAPTNLGMVAVQQGSGAFPNQQAWTNVPATSPSGAYANGAAMGASGSYPNGSAPNPYAAGSGYHQTTGGRVPTGWNEAVRPGMSTGAKVVAIVFAALAVTGIGVAFGAYRSQNRNTNAATAVSGVAPNTPLAGMQQPLGIAPGGTFQPAPVVAIAPSPSNPMGGVQPAGTQAPNAPGNPMGTPAQPGGAPQQPGVDPTAGAAQPGTGNAQPGADPANGAQANGEPQPAAPSDESPSRNSHARPSQPSAPPAHAASPPARPRAPPESPVYRQGAAVTQQLQQAASQADRPRLARRYQAEAERINNLLQRARAYDAQANAVRASDPGGAASLHDAAERFLQQAQDRMQRAQEDLQR